jgi:predicted transcriptional regulator
MPRTDWKNRSRLEIIGNILGVAKYGAKKTHIMYRANLSYSQLQEYVGFLTNGASWKRSTASGRTKSSSRRATSGSNSSGTSGSSRGSWPPQ